MSGIMIHSLCHAAYSEVSGSSSRLFLPLWVILIQINSLLTTVHRINDFLRLSVVPLLNGSRLINWWCGDLFQLDAMMAAAFVVFHSLTHLALFGRQQRVRENEASVQKPLGASGPLPFCGLKTTERRPPTCTSWRGQRKLGIILKHHHHRHRRRRGDNRCAPRRRDPLERTQTQ